MKYDPIERRYHVEHEHLGVELGRRIVDDSLKLVRALGYDLNSPNGRSATACPTPSTS